MKEKIGNWINSNITNVDFERWLTLKQPSLRNSDRRSYEAFLGGLARQCASETKKTISECRFEIRQYFVNQDHKTASKGGLSTPRRDNTSGKFTTATMDSRYRLEKCSVANCKIFCEFAMPILKGREAPGIILFDEEKPGKPRENVGYHISRYIVDKTRNEDVLPGVASNRTFRCIQNIAREALKMLIGTDPGQPTGAFINYYQNVENSAPSHRDVALKGTVVVLLQQDQKKSFLYISKDPVHRNHNWHPVELKVGSVLAFVPKITHAYRGGCTNRCILSFFF